MLEHGMTKLRWQVTSKGALGENLLYLSNKVLPCLFSGCIVRHLVISVVLPEPCSQHFILLTHMLIGAL